MKRTLFILIVAGLSTLTAFGQESGNRGVYGPKTDRRNPSTGVVYGSENKDLVPAQFIEAYVLFNAAPDEFIAVFGATQEALSPSKAIRRSTPKSNSLLERQAGWA